MAHTLKRLLSPILNGIVDRWEKATRQGRTRRFTRRLVGPGDLVFDVGANLGARTTLYLEMGARVVAVEPIAQCVEHLLERLGSHPRCTVLPCALGEREGKATIRFSSEATNMASLSEEWIQAVGNSTRLGETGGWQETQEVDMTTLDRLVSDYGLPAFCKIDVEGYEEQVLNGLSRPLPLLSFEFTPERPRAAENVMRRLQALADYEYNYSLSERSQMVFRRWQTSDTFARFLREKATRTGVYGDVYARRIPPESAQALSGNSSAAPSQSETEPEKDA